MMKIVFYDTASGSLGIQYLTAIARNGGHTVYLYLDPSASRDYLAHDLLLKQWLSLSVSDIINDLTALQPDMVCFSMNSYYYQRLLEIIKALKKVNPDIVIVCGGIHVTLLPALVLGNEEIDFAIVGEGEQSFKSLLDALSTSPVDQVKALSVTALQGVWNVYAGAVLDRGVSLVFKDLDQIPFPDKTLLYEANPALATVYCTTASRGCPCSCSYCNSASVRALYSCCDMEYYRSRSVSNVIQELKIAKTKYPMRHIEFYDDMFGVSQAWLLEFGQRYKVEIGLPYGIETSPLVLNEAKIDILADSGCVSVEIGVQSANMVVRRDLLNRHETNERVTQMARYAVEHGILVELDLIVNLPGEMPEHLTETLDLVSESRPQMVNLSYLQYLPKTDIIKTALEQGYLTPQDVNDIELGGRPKGVRFLPKSGLSTQYRLLPFQVFLAARLPQKWAKSLNWIIEKPLIGPLLSFFATPFLYVSRLLLGVLDRRNYFLRWQTSRFLRSNLRVLARKVLRGNCGVPRKP